MKNEILQELAERWKKDVDADSNRPEPPGEAVLAATVRSYYRGRRETMRECADALTMLISILP